MEDNVFGVFRSDNAKIVYKQILNIDEVISLNDCLTQNINNNLTITNRGTSLVPGIRKHIDIDLKTSNHKYLCDRLNVVLSDYFPDITIDPNVRLYNQPYGSVKPHIDKSHDSKSNYAMLIYLTDNFNDGKLSIKIKRTPDEMVQYKNNEHDKIFTFRPMRGYGIIFDKNLLHYASEVYDNNKNFLLIHFYSCF